MRPEIVEDEEDFAIRIFNKRFEELDQPICAEVLFIQRVLP